jgi:CubicO group peptidase (beta-lactamase class C family)
MIDPGLVSLLRGQARRRPGTMARLALAASLVPTLLAAQDLWPTDRWKESTPEEQGVDSAALGEAIDYIIQKRLPIHSMLVVRHGAVVVDAYFYPYEPEVPHDIASVTKSVTSILTGIAIDKGYVKSVKQPVLQLLNTAPPAAADPRRSRMTVENLLTMTSGMECGAINAAHTAEPELDEMRHTSDWIRYAVNIPMRAEPGSQFAYCSVNNHLLSAVITATTGESLEAFARRNLFDAMGIRQLLWPADPKGLSHGWGDLHLYPRDMAKLGYLYLHAGKWEGRQLVSEKWVRASLEPHAAVRAGVGYGYSWWINVARQPNIPEAEGRAGQRISIVPDKDTVVVFTAGGADTDEVAPYILRALRSDAPLAANAAAFSHLTQSLRAARLAPAPVPLRKLPDAARRISGRKYSFDSNALDLRTLSLVFDGNDEAHVALKVGHEEWTGPVGLDGVYRFSPNGHRRLPMAVSGTWRSDTEFLLDVNLFPNITRILFTIRFVGDRAELDVTDTTGSFHDVNLSGVAPDR